MAGSRGVTTKSGVLRLRASFRMAALSCWEIARRLEERTKANNLLSVGEELQQRIVRQPGIVDLVADGFSDADANKLPVALVKYLVPAVGSQIALAGR